LNPDDDLDDAIGTALAEVQRHADVPGVHSTALGIDPLTWEVMHFILWAESASDHTAGVRYEVLHLSTPQLNDLARGRQW